MKKILALVMALCMIFALAACGQSAAPAAGNTAPAEADTPEDAEEDAQELPAEEPEVEYRVRVTDPEGNPLPEITVQFCDEVLCTEGETDADGAAVFTAKETAACTVHILQAPKGVVASEEEFTFPGGEKEISITLETREPAFEDPESGFAFYDPEQYGELKGAVEWYALKLDYDVSFLQQIYLPVEKENTSAVEQMMSTGTNGVALFRLFIVRMDEARAHAFMTEALGGEDDSFEIIGSTENVTCFLIKDLQEDGITEQYKARLGAFYDEYAALREDTESFVSGIKLSRPVREKFLFEAQDLNGNPVSLADLLAGHKVTMIDVWETGCKPCIEEMPELQELSKEFEEQDCQIIGVCLTMHSVSNEETTIKKAQDIVAEAGVTYPVLIAKGDEHERLKKVTAFPTKFFVDSEGALLEEPVFGAFADPQVYLDVLETALPRAWG